MFELVSTSLPNGLLPGTHGFATVAMTRGTPDPVRIALESLSSYKHRHTGHDERYATENPVAWSHLVQRDGSHVLSCVQAADFDYTGRTNRLARHWCFPRGEFPPGGNAADMVAANAAALSAAWTGEARWIDPVVGTAVSPAARDDAKAAAWVRLYGPERGPSLAAGFAALLRAELQGANRPTIFRTSQAWDADGTILLRLFADVIALLPAQLRDRATFSTYPAALSDFTTCHLRGLQPDDPKFAAFTAGRTWFDCAAGEVHGTLPQDPDLLQLARDGRVAPVPSVASEREESRLRSAAEPATAERGYPPRPIPASRPDRTTEKRTASASRTSDWLPPPKKDNTMMYAIVAGAAISICLVAAAVLLLRKLPTTTEDTKPVQEEPVLGELDGGNEGALAESPSVPDASGHAGAVEADADRPAGGQADLDVPPEATDDADAGEPVPAPRTEAPRESTKPKWDFEAAERLVSAKQDAKEFGSGAYFFYPSATRPLERQVAETKDPPVGVGGGKTWGKPPAFETCLVLYDEKAKTIYFERKTVSARLFADGNDADLKKLCFGPDPAVFDVWDRLCDNWIFRVEWERKSEGQGAMRGSFQLGRNHFQFSAQEAIEILAKDRLEQFEQKKRDIKEQRDEVHTKRLAAEAFDIALEDLGTQIKAIEDKGKSAQGDAKAASTGKNEKSGEDTPSKSKADQVREYVDKLDESTRKAFGFEPSDSFEKIKEKQTKLHKENKRTLEKSKEDEKELEKKLKQAELERDKFLDDVKGSLRSIRFTVSVEAKAKENN